MEKKKCFIIAEAGVNHNGKMELAYKLIDAAKEAGVDCIKFQTFKTEKVISKNTEMATYQKENLKFTVVTITDYFSCMKYYGINLKILKF